ncbi:SusC/RagA family TonB-linked outer membrane protein [Mucilaginibacter ginsenosidivorax]|uniref:TonB-dependent receptor n=1 Tax=Mucilaginibacter ginsenosidivorax TaxID=862126 RepID=A0A5B8WBJ9_9SPHI|nr:TonB-dependent receptor [Mucilaginibacter ginsenosidivorax]QEC80226.1 TonB-dependent receptor [Mucilaginibacter ginsenosidivorax]
MRKILRMALLFLSLFVCFRAGAQNQATVIKGTVTDDKGITLPGASVRVKNGQASAITDKDGNYSISVPSGATELTFSFIGMKSQDVLIGKKTVINVVLVNMSTTLTDVVVIGYGQQKRQDVNGAISSVTAKDIQNIPQTSVDQLLQGKAAGVTVTNGTGAPGSSASVHIRGITSLSGSNEPLYVVDGVYIDGSAYTTQNQNNGENTVSPLSYINPNDIASIDILKDASATAIYGSRGSNGVIIITTKKGKNSSAHLNYDGYYGIQQQGHFLKMMNLPQYAAIQNEIADITGIGRRGEFADPTVLGPGTDWQKAVFRTAPMQSHNLSMNGGNENVNYYISGGFLKQNGTIIASNFKRYSFRTNVEGKLKDWFKLGSNMTLNRTDQNIGASDNGGIVYQALLNAPDQAASNPDGSYTVAPASYGSGVFISPVALASLNTNNLVRSQINANFYADIRFLKNLTLRSEIGGYNNFSKSVLFFPSYTVTSPTNPSLIYGNPVAKLSEYTDQALGWNWKEYITYNHTFAQKHNVTATAGYELNEGMYNSMSAGTDTFLSNDLPTLNLGGAKIPSIGENKSSNTLQSFYARAIYDYDSRYSLTATIRSDRSSNFAQGHQTGYFPSAAFGWTVSNESFMAGIKSVADNVKFRIGYGEVGNQNIPGYQYGSALNPTITGLGTGFNVSNYNNPNLTWQTSIQTDIGLDFTLFGRVNVAADWYNKTSKKFLFQAPLPEFLTGGPNYLGGISSLYVNGGEVSNKGIEFSINSKNIVSKNFNWNTTVTFSHYVNKVVSTYNNSIITASVTSGFLQIPVTRTQVGGPIGEFYGYTVKGIFKTADQLQNAPIQFGQPISTTLGTLGSTTLGDIQYVDTNHDGKIDASDMSAIGNPNPTFTYGFTNNFSYKGIDLSIFLYGSYGGKVLNYLDYTIEGLNGLYTNQLAEAANYWSPSNPNATIPAPKGGVNPNLNMSTRFLQSASFLRFQNVRLGYNVPAAWAKRIALSGLKVYCSAQNLFVITGYKGLDPEVGQQNQNVFLTNVDLGRYPSPRVISFGINAEF